MIAWRGQFARWKVKQGCVKLADFEGLIRQALLRQDDSDPAIREKIYQSSRNALERMIASAPNQNPEAAQTHRKALEVSIRRIEAGYVPPQAPVSHPSSVHVQPPEPSFDSRQGDGDDGLRADPGPTSFDHGRPEPVLLDDPHPGFADGDRFDDHSHDDRLDYGADDEDRENVSRAMLARRGSSARRNLVIVLTLLAIIGFGWLGYTFYTTIFEPDANWAAQDDSNPKGNTGSRDDNDGGTYVGLLSASDTAALDTQGRGTAEIVTQSNTDMLRLSSLRASDHKNETAKPILLSVQPGVLSRISGKKVTVEIRAKSGGTGPATFAVSCEFDGQELCGRKRFRVGLQPEVMVFKLDVPASANQSSDAYFALSTDITGSAALTGQGDVIDIEYARLRLDGE